MARPLAIMTVVICLSSCAPQGYHYETGGFVPKPNDACMRSEMSSPGAVSLLSATLGHEHGVPSQVAIISDLASADRIQLSSIGLRFPSDSGSVLCHATLTFANGSAESGVMSVNDPGAYAPLQVEWMSDVAIAARRAEADRLAISTKLFVKPDLITSGIQQCVGRETALGVGEEFPGQLWAACADPNYKRR